MKQSHDEWCLLNLTNFTLPQQQIQIQPATPTRHQSLSHSLSFYIYLSGQAFTHSYAKFLFRCHLVICILLSALSGSIFKFDLQMIFNSPRSAWRWQHVSEFKLPGAGCRYSASLSLTLTLSFSGFSFFYFWRACLTFYIYFLSFIFFFLLKHFVA